MRALLVCVLAIGVADQAPAPAAAREAFQRWLWGGHAEAAQDSARGGGPPAVRIDAIVSDAQGRAITDLRLADFEIVDDGRPLPLESVRFLTADRSARLDETLQPILSRADEQVEAEREGTRLFAFFLDEYHVAPGAATARARETVARFVDEFLGPRDLLLVIKPLDSLLALRLTRDRDQATRAIATFEGRKGDLEPRNPFEKDYIGGGARVEAVRDQIVISALNALTTHLGSLGGGRKTLVVVSEGFGGTPRRRGDEALPTLEGVIRSAGQAGVSIDAIDPRALGPDAGGEVGSTSGRDTLLALASETGGHAVLEPADVADGLRRIVRDASTYYVITFRSDREPDGRFHPVDVRVKRPGVQVRARKGYWAALTGSPSQARPAILSAEASVTALPRRISPLIRPWFGLARGSDGKTRVSFVWEPARPVPGDRNVARIPARIVMKASRPDGTPVFEGVVRPTGAPAADGSESEPQKAVFETEPNRLRVQMSIEDASARVVDTDIRDVVAGPLAGPVVLGTAEVLRARTALEYRRLLGDLSAAPAAAREFSRAERLLIRVPVYAPGPSALAARLVSKMGATMRELTVTAAPRADLHHIDLPLASLAPGEYLVEIRATSAAGDASDAVAFRVTP